jgi:hypothetical protein
MGGGSSCRVVEAALRLRTENRYFDWESPSLACTFGAPCSSVGDFAAAQRGQALAAPS